MGGGSGRWLVSRACSDTINKPIALFREAPPDPQPEHSPKSISSKLKLDTRKAEAPRELRAQQQASL